MQASGIRRVLLIADSLAFHGPEQPELLTHPGLYPNVMAAALGAEIDVVARFGWTARDAWWALTKDPTVYSVLLPRADAVVFGVGGMDSLPASLPTYLREGIAFIRPGWVRRFVRRTYHRAHPHVVRLTDGRLRVLPQAATDMFLSRAVQGIRALHPGVPIVTMTPAPWDSWYYPVNRGHAAAREAALAWAAREDVPILDVEAIVAPSLIDGSGNPDGMHWSWDVHQAIGNGLADLVRHARMEAE
ncbi:MAG: diglucosylglycerate octanoyltransferase [Actinomycetes bacterium]